MDRLFLRKFSDCYWGQVSYRGNLVHGGSSLLSRFPSESIALSIEPSFSTFRFIYLEMPKVGVKDRIGWAAFPARLGPLFCTQASDKNLIY
jgi:hypothetical protein